MQALTSTHTHTYTHTTCTCTRTHACARPRCSGAALQLQHMLQQLRRGRRLLGTRGHTGGGRGGHTARESRGPQGARAAQEAQHREARGQENPALLLHPVRACSRPVLPDCLCMHLWGACVGGHVWGLFAQGTGPAMRGVLAWQALLAALCCPGAKCLMSDSCMPIEEGLFA